MTVKIDGTNTEANPAFTGADTDTGLQCGTNELKLVTGGTARATVDSSGKLGVATTSPQSKLSVGNAASTNDGLSITFTGNNSTVAKYFANTSTGEVTIGGVASNYFPTFHSNGSEAMRLDANGRLLVGTGTAPSVGSFAQTARLVSQGNTTENIGGAVLSLQRGEAATSITSGEYLGNICFTDNAGKEFARIDGLADGTAGGVNGNPGKLVFRTEVAGSDNGPVERLKIDSNGVFTTNGVLQHFARGASTGNSSFTRDFSIGATQSAIVIAAFNHYGLFGYGCVKMSFAAVGGSFSTHDVESYSSGNGGSWAISKVNNSTIRVTKNAGTHTGSGYWFIHVISS